MLNLHRNQTSEDVDVNKLQHMHRDRKQKQTREDCGSGPLDSYVVFVVVFLFCPCEYFGAWVLDVKILTCFVPVHGLALQSVNPAQGQPK